MLVSDDDLQIDWSDVDPALVRRADVTPENFGRIAAQTAKQVILQRIREAEREMMYDEYIDRVGEVVTGIVQQAGDRNNVLVDLGKVEALLPRSEQVDGERYEQGSRIKAVITEVRSGTKGPQVILSRRDPELIRTLFELEVPEIADGLVDIKGVAREPGYRSKIAVESHAQGVDPVGACVGPRGSRVRMVVSELRGEKIDIIPWNPEPARFVAKALSPARVREVYIDDETREATVVVPDDQLALAIGKEGLNARLAARLTGWKVDIQSDTEFAQAEAEAAFAGADGDDFTGRCVAILSTGKRCPNAALPGSRFCGVACPPGARQARGGRRGPRRPDRPDGRRRDEGDANGSGTSQPRRRAGRGQRVDPAEVGRPDSSEEAAGARGERRRRGGGGACCVTRARSAPVPAAGARRRRRSSCASSRGTGVAARTGATAAGPGRVHVPPARRASSGRSRRRAFARVLRQPCGSNPFALDAPSTLSTMADGPNEPNADPAPPGRRTAGRRRRVVIDTGAARPRPDDRRVARAARRRAAEAAARGRRPDRAGHRPVGGHRPRALAGARHPGRRRSSRS